MWIRYYYRWKRLVQQRGKGKQKKPKKEKVMKFISVVDKKDRRVEIVVDSIESLTCLNGTHTKIRTVSGAEFTVAESTKRIGERIAHAASNTEVLS